MASLTFSLIPPAARPKRWRLWAVYGMGAVTAIILPQAYNLFAGGSGLWTAQVNVGLAFAWYGIFQATTMAAIFYNFRLIRRAGGGPHTRYFFLATCAAAVTVAGYFILALTGPAPVPRFLQDGLLLAAVGLFGYAVARYQAFVERQTTLQDLPVAGLTVLGLAGLYAVLAEKRGFTPSEVAGITVLAIVTHSGVDLMRELLDRLLHQREGALRQNLRRLVMNAGGEGALLHNLRRGLGILLNRLNASSGFIALRRDDGFEVCASLHSRPVGTHLAEAECAELYEPGPKLATEVAWLAPALAAGQQIALVGLGPPRAARGPYSENELDVLAGVADWVGLLVATHQQQQQTHEHLRSLAAEAQTREVGLQAGAEDLLVAMQMDPQPEFSGQVEEALRHLADYTWLGQSPLVAQLEIVGSTHVERGKALRQQMVRALETLRPAGPRPSEPLPREWYNYTVLHDAYVEDVPNREIMARLYIAHGTFNRVRRSALRAVTRNLIEMRAPAAAAGAGAA